MTTATYAINVDGEQVATMTADFAQASSPLRLDGESTPFQVADARHRRDEAAEKLLNWAWSHGGAVCEMDDDGDVVGEITVEEISELVGQRVEAGEGDDYDNGTVDSVDGNTATVRWDSLVVTTCPVSALRTI